MIKQLFPTLGDFIENIKSVSEYDPNLDDGDLVSPEEAKKNDEEVKREPSIRGLDPKGLAVTLMDLRRVMDLTISAKLEAGVMENFVKFNLINNSDFIAPNTLGFSGWLRGWKNGSLGGRLDNTYYIPLERSSSPLYLTFPRHSSRSDTIGDRFINVKLTSSLFPDRDRMLKCRSYSNGKTVAFAVQGDVSYYTEDLNIMSADRDSHDNKIPQYIENFKDENLGFAESKYGSKMTFKILIDDPYFVKAYYKYFGDEKKLLAMRTKQQRTKNKAKSEE